MSKVGRSSRTPYKHWVLDSHLGKICGSLSTGKVPAIASPLICIDLCAGDGHRNEFHECSPFIIMKHCEWLHRSNSRCTAKSVFIEKDASTYETLIDNSAKYVTCTEFRKRWANNKDSNSLLHSARFLNLDARQIRINAPHERQAVFINCDPNSIAELPCAPQLVASLTPMTTMTITLGCNTGGLKRMPLDKRQEWFDYIDILIDAMPSWHDAILIEVVRDAAQWAYLTRLPAKWTEDVAESCVKRGGRHFVHGVQVESLRRSKDRFSRMRDRLFLTKKELKDASATTRDIG